MKASTALLLGGAAVAGTIAAAALLGKKGAEGEAATIGLSLEPFGDDIGGKKIELNPGDQVTFYVRVNNTSKRAGNFVPASLITSWTSSIPGVGLGQAKTRTDSYPANDGKEFTYSLTVPTDAKPDFGSITFLASDPQGTVLATVWVNVNILARVPTGSLSTVLLYYDEVGMWVQATEGMRIPWNAKITVAPQWLNGSAFSIPGHVELVATKPGGGQVTLGAVQGNDKVADPMNGFIVAFEALTMDQEGKYLFTAQLSSGGTLLDTLTFSLNAVADTVYSAWVSARRG